MWIIIPRSYQNVTVLSKTLPQILSMCLLKYLIKRDQVNLMGLADPIQSRKKNNNIPKFWPLGFFNDTHREILVFHSIQYRNGWLAAYDLFHLFAQSINFYTFHFQYRCLKNVIPQIDSKNGWLLLSASLRQNLG